MGMRPIGRLGIASIAFGALLMIGGELGGGGLGALAQGYGLLVVLSGLFIVGGLALRHLLESHRSPAEAPRATRRHVGSIR
jgi:hypothetical protein